MAPGLAVIDDGSFAVGVGSRRSNGATSIAAAARTAAASADVRRAAGAAARSTAAAGNGAALSGAARGCTGGVTGLSGRSCGDHLGRVGSPPARRQGVPGGR